MTRSVCGLLRSHVFCFAALTLASCLGCTSDVVKQLDGQWVGRPDTAAARREREAEAFGPVATTEDSDGGASEVKPVNQRPPTDWERYDVTVHLNFLGNSRLELQMEGQPKKVVADWSVVEQTPASLVLQLKTNSDDPSQAPPAKSNPEEPTPVLRRFELLPTIEEGKLVGFSWREVDAERQVGSLYFTRPKGEPEALAPGGEALAPGSEASAPGGEASAPGETTKAPAD